MARPKGSRNKLNASDEIIHKGENTDNTPAKSDKVARLSFGSK